MQPEAHCSRPSPLPPLLRHGLRSSALIVLIVRTDVDEDASLASEASPPEVATPAAASGRPEAVARLAKAEGAGATAAPEADKQEGLRVPELQRAVRLPHPRAAREGLRGLLPPVQGPGGPRVLQVSRHQAKAS